MGQQISHDGVENLDVVHEHGARADLAEADYGYLSSRVEKLVKLAQSSLATRVYLRSQSQQNSNKRQKLLQEDGSMISSPVGAARDTLPLQFSDIRTVDLSNDTHEYDMGVAVSDVLLEPLGLYCHIPVRKVCKVDTCNIGCQTADESHCYTTRVNETVECLLSETSGAKSEAFNCMNDEVTVNEIDVATLKGSGEIFVSNHGLGMDAKAGTGVCNAEPNRRSRPPQRTKLITTPETVLQSAYESRPPEIGSYLAVAPVVPSSDLGLSPIDETAEVAATTMLQCRTDTFDTALQDRDAVFSNRKVTKHVKPNIVLQCSTPCDGQHQLLESQSVFLSQDDSSYFPQTSSPYFTANLSKNKDESVNESERCNVCFAYYEPELDMRTNGHDGSNLDTSAFDPVWTEWETALSCCDFSTNNNESGNPKAARMNMSPGTGPLIARRQVRHCSDGSAPLSSSLPSTGSGQLRAMPARSTSQLSLDDIVVSPRTVPERLDFQQLEKFEGRYSVVC